MKRTLTTTLLFAFIINFFAATHTVNSGSYYYSPSSLTVNVNDTVVWVNDGGYHNVNFDINTITGTSFNNPVSFTLHLQMEQQFILMYLLSQDLIIMIVQLDLMLHQEW